MAYLQHRLFVFLRTGKNYQENRIENGMYRMQKQEAVGDQTVQAFRTGRRQKEEGQ